MYFFPLKPMTKTIQWSVSYHPPARPENPNGGPWFVKCFQAPWLGKAIFAQANRALKEVPCREINFPENPGKKCNFHLKTNWFLVSRYLDWQFRCGLRHFWCSYLVSERWHRVLYTSPKCSQHPPAEFQGVLDQICLTNVYEAKGPYSMDWYFMGKSMVSCKFSLKPLHCFLVGGVEDQWCKGGDLLEPWKQLAFCTVPSTHPRS